MVSSTLGGDDREGGDAKLVKVAGIDPLGDSFERTAVLRFDVAVALGKGV